MSGSPTLREQVSWPIATLVALLVPALVFWTFVAISAPSGARGVLPIACGLWLAMGVLLTRTTSRRWRSWGVGLAAGALACLPWSLIPGLVSR